MKPFQTQIREFLLLHRFTISHVDHDTGLMFFTPTHFTEKLAFKFVDSFIMLLNKRHRISDYPKQITKFQIHRDMKLSQNMENYSTIIKYQLNNDTRTTYKTPIEF